MWGFDNLATDLKGTVLTITINREKKLNALDTDTLSEFRQAFQLINQESEIKAVIITGSGAKAFAAGADIEEIRTLDHLHARKFAESGQEVFRTIENCSKPVLAAVNGFALGGGCELAMACHLRVAVATAKFGQPEVNLGLVPGYGGTQRLTRLIGRSRALELMLTGDIIDAPQAHEYGLVNYLTETPEAMMKTSQQILDTILSRAPLAVGKVIQCVNAAFKPGTDGYQTEALAFADCCDTGDFVEGTTAFLEKRKPVFLGI